MRLSNETQHDSPQLNSPFYRGERTRIAKEARTTAPRALVVVPKANLEYVKHKASNEPLRQTAESRSMQTSDYKDIDSNRFTSLNISVPQHATKPSSSPKFNVSRKERRVHRENPEEEMSTPPDVVTDTSLLIEEVRSGPESLSKECIPSFTRLSKAEWFYQNFKGVLKPSLCVIGLVFLLYKTTSMPEYIYDIRMILPLQWQRHSIFEISTFDFFIAKTSQFLSLPLSIAPSMSFVWYCCWSFVGCSLVFS